VQITKKLLSTDLESEVFGEAKVVLFLKYNGQLIHVRLTKYLASPVSIFT
jgi:hypothetical protein